jgi:hypothetical protein
MKLDIARGLFLAGALAVVSLAVVAWEQPRTEVLGSVQGDPHCPLPRIAKASIATNPDQDFFLFMFGLSQGMRPQS